MSAILNPYISFNGNAREAMDFYQSVFGGEVTRSTYAEGGMSGTDNSNADLIMHSMLTAPNGMVLMCSDATPDSGGYNPGTNMSVSLSGDDEAQLTSLYEKLSVDGKVAMPLSKAPWGDSFGMFNDKFGVMWMVNIAGPKA